MFKKGFLAILLTIFIFLIFSPILAQNDASIPQTLTDAQSRGKNVLSAVPGVLERLWTEFKGYLNQFVGWLVNAWKIYIDPRIRSFWSANIESRKPLVEQEFQKEKGEVQQNIKNEAPKIWNDIWGRFKALIK